MEADEKYLDSTPSSLMDMREHFTLSADLAHGRISWEEAEAEPQPQPQPQPEPQPEPTISTTATTSSTSDVVVAAAATVSSPIGQPVTSGYAPPDKVVSSFASTSSQSAISSSSTESLSSATPLLSPPNIQPQTVDGPKQEAV